MYKMLALILFLTGICFEVGAVRAEDADVNRWRHPDANTRTILLKLARHAFDAYALRRETIAPPANVPALLRDRAGVFVSAMRNRAPRCCMGTVYPLESNIAREIIANAVAAAGHDRRFPPIKPAELKSLTLIVSIVGRPQPITPAQLETLDPAQDGLLVRNGSRSGIVLSRETTRHDRMLQWGRIRAGAGPNTPVELFRLDVVRFVENEEDKP